jgi:hypothetical protein
LRDLFLGHCEKQQAKLLALAGGLHWRFGVESVVFRMDDSLLKMIWDQAQKRSVVPPMVFDPPPPHKPPGLEVLEQDMSEQHEDLSASRHGHGRHGQKVRRSGGTRKKR